MLADQEDATGTRWRAKGGLAASMCFLAVLLWIPNSLATPRMNNPLRFAFCTATGLPGGVWASFVSRLRSLQPRGPIGSDAIASRPGHSLLIEGRQRLSPASANAVAMEVWHVLV